VVAAGSFYQRLLIDAKRGDAKPGDLRFVPESELGPADNKLDEIRRWASKLET
jgi:hypothetical protein